jgi:hypothetical protein
MTIKTLTAVAVVSAALSGPVFAQQASKRAPGHHAQAHDLRNFRGVYNQAPVNGPLYVAPGPRDGWSVEGFGRDPSQVGGVDPSLRPSGS